MSLQTWLCTDGGILFYLCRGSSFRNLFSQDREFFQFHIQQLCHFYKDCIWILFVCYIVNMQMKEKKQRQKKKVRKYYMQKLYLADRGRQTVLTNRLMLYQCMWWEEQTNQSHISTIKHPLVELLCNTQALKLQRDFFLIVTNISNPQNYGSDGYSVTVVGHETWFTMHFGRGC